MDPGVVAAYVVGGLGVLAAFVSGALAIARGRSNGRERPTMSIAEGAAGQATVGDWQKWIAEIVAKASAESMTTQLGPFLLEVQRHNKAMERRLTQLNRIVKIVKEREEERR
ncbi:MAG: hypothetical protein A2V88_12295 [Elusimicrobia bacterium RBG_16_66_12]|nr:MAG: hypothetical protein A2V88_12295 [Elusimicrobia bacterium RBG_16_66_12]